jgi:hypothetical protein
MKQPPCPDHLSYLEHFLSGIHLKHKILESAVKGKRRRCDGRKIGDEGRKNLSPQTRSRCELQNISPKGFRGLKRDCKFG